MKNIFMEAAPSSRNKIPEDVSKKLEKGRYEERGEVRTWEDLKNVAKFKISSAFEETSQIRKEAEKEVARAKETTQLPLEQVREIEAEKGVDMKIIEVGERFGIICADLTWRIKKIIEEEKQKVNGKKDLKITEKNVDEIAKSLQKIMDVYGKFKDDVNQLKKELEYVLADFRAELEKAQKQKIIESL